MKIFNNTYSPNFNARFSNDKITKNHLGSMINTLKDTERVSEIVENLETIDSDGTISLTKMGYNIVATSSATNKAVNLGNTHSSDPLFVLETILKEPDSKNYKKLFGDECKVSHDKAQVGKFTELVNKNAKTQKYIYDTKQIANRMNQLYKKQREISRQIGVLETQQYRTNQAYITQKRAAILSAIG